MGALFSAPGQAWPWLGILAVGALLGLATAPPDRSLTTWLALVVVPLGTIGYALALVPAFAIVGPLAAAPAAALVAVGTLTFALATGRIRRTRLPAQGRSELAWLSATTVLAGWAARAAARLAHAASVGIPIPGLLGEPAPGDVALTALRAALVARHGIPPPSPLDPDYPLQYRYLFHTLAASFAVHGADDYARITAAALGLLIGAIVLAGAALAATRLRTGLMWPAAGLLAALHGPSYLLPDAIQALTSSGLKWAGLERYIVEHWALSPLVPSFPSTLSSVESAPAIPAGVLSWLVVLLVGGWALPRFPFQDPGRGDTGSFMRAGVLGVLLGALAFAADFFVPFALLSATMAALLVGGSRRWLRHWVPTVVGVAAGLAGALAVVMLCTRQLAPAGAATGLALRWNDAFGTTATYGGNRALLAGGTPLPMPNWVHVHDWGVLFWPALLFGLAISWRARDALFLWALLAPLLAAVFWHACTVSYEAGLPTDLRVQMYRFATMATGVVGAPALVALAAAVERALPPGWARWAVCAALAMSTVIIGAGAGLLLSAGSTRLPREVPAQLQVETALAGRLAAEPPGGRFALLGGPSTFIGMYSRADAGYMPVWWSISGTPVPVGWDFGHPERYQTRYRRVVEAFDAGAAAELGLTHVALAADALGVEQLERARRFLARCGAVELARSSPTERDREKVLYRISPAACAASG